ncbi:16S rRNA (adenine(1518)-N(6)/adenine(1519)-N(6))-dimethyltransferase RsmA [Ureaplasma sp. ES3154-GEN]|uniref:16S rRNA (adenine(1518)-N(6)/adenine(1519)-N(6))- dimethyltransferase RsmA n=1 Tax=Ureaplasma sp. ES3154-GEN TaxID=2984844 RepID=UPI0021E6EEEB|nr:16S rRNA (adenine(1518)-N(6)/adenine(1519)-N(6))-dimethyltransferase RsmA [Ureaplasma sp. ES3154-GEN]MCV3743476.1 16S rRNA (adenine(1518)-N(6)/adenine(1519)-N(6))-dimethyltransferase RsmA [Ureaplasma sp. ES3154-GEN]
MTEKDIKHKLHKESFVPSKKMGQNFLLSNQIKKRIVDEADVGPDDLVIEIGPGLGAITDILVQRAKFVQAIELDKRLYAHLIERIKVINFNVINQDVLKLDLDQLILDLLAKQSYKNIKVVANLPYSISSKIIEKLIKCQFIQKSFIMVQKEMADRITARVNSKDYNAFSVFVQMFAESTTLFDVPPQNFYPAPQVMSSVVLLENTPAVCNDPHTMLKFLRLSFLNRRKKLVNNLCTVYPKSRVLDALNELKLNENIRAQNLTQTNFINLFKILIGGTNNEGY